MLAAQHATQRRQFQTRIADFEMIRAKFARMVANTYALEAMVYLTAGLVDRGLPDYSLEGACCKVFGTESAWRTINDALQIAGGNGFMEEYPYERALRDSRINMIFEGTNEILRALVALSGMRDAGEDLQEVARAMKAPLTSFGVLSDYAARKIRGYVLAGTAREGGAGAPEGGRGGLQVRRRRGGRGRDAPAQVRQGRARQAVPPGAARQRRDRSLRLPRRALPRDRRRSRGRGARRRPKRSGWREASCRARSTGWSGT